MSDIDDASMKLICGEILQAEGRIAAVKKLRLLTGWTLRQSIEWINYEFPHARDQQHREAGCAEGRRQGLEEAAKIVAEAQAEVQENIDQNVMEVGVMQIKPSDNWPLIRARDWLRACHENIVALAKEPKS